MLLLEDMFLLELQSEYGTVEFILFPAEEIKFTTEPFILVKRYFLI